MHVKISLLLAMVLIAGCTQVDENPAWNPQADYPSWAYDAPFYHRPSDDLKVAEMFGPGIPLYYTASEYFFIKHPAGYQVSGAPRISVWCSNDDGRQWVKSGFYGVEQTHFLFQADQDGPQWIRFVGPGQGVAVVSPGMPHRIYVVDRTPPRIVVTVTPSQWVDEQKTTPRVYKVGDEVMLRWSVSDPNLREDSIRLAIAFAAFPKNLVWARWPKPLSPVGEETVMIPAAAARDGGLRFRIEATDKAGNLGMGVTEVLRVSPASGQVASQPVAHMIGQLSPIAPGEGPNERPGWPATGSFLRGGTAGVLKWLPENVKDYPSVELQFSVNNGQTWSTIVTGLKHSQAVKWTVPNVSSRKCRLRVVGVKTDDQGDELPFMLAMTQPFTVDTVAPPVILGPKLITAEE